jgi:hypothetical protein
MQRLIVKNKELYKKLQEAIAEKDALKRTLDKMRKKKEKKKGKKEREEKIKKLQERIKWINSRCKKEQRLSIEMIQSYIDKVREGEEEQPGRTLDAAAGRRRGK